MAVTFRTGYDGVRIGDSDKDFSNDPGMTRQSEKDSCDINIIMRQYQKTGLLTHVREHQGEYGEFVEMDFHAAMNAVTSAQQMFETVPSEIRAKFGNDPGAFLDAVTDPERVEEIRQLGLLPSERVAEPAEPVQEPPPPAE